MVNDEALRPWWNTLAPEIQQRWREWRGLDPVPDDLAAQLSEHMGANNLGRFLFWQVVPNTAPPVNQWAATERLAVFIEGQR